MKSLFLSRLLSARSPLPSLYLQRLVAPQTQHFSPTSTLTTLHSLRQTHTLFEPMAPPRRGRGGGRGGRGGRGGHGPEPYNVRNMSERRPQRVVKKQEQVQ